jgi:surfactin synthase thioesterase subunit
MMSIISLNKPKTVEANVFCFHWVGGTSTGFKSLATSAEGYNVKVYGVSLPGRGGRNVDQVPKSMTDLVDKLHEQFVSNMHIWALSSCPLILLGHSFGGIIAFELARKIKACGRLNVQPSKLIVSAIKNPASLSDDNKNDNVITHHTQSNEELLDYIIYLGGNKPFQLPCFFKHTLYLFQASPRVSTNSSWYTPCPPCERTTRSSKPTTTRSAARALWTAPSLPFLPAATWPSTAT